MRIEMGKPVGKRILLMMIGLSLLFGGCANEAQQGVPSTTQSINKISAEEAKDRMDGEEEIILLDVRTQEEYDVQHIPNAVLIPLDSIGDKAEAVIPDKEAVYFVYCRSGNRSEAATVLLMEMGYVNVFDLGGLNHWPYEMVKRQ